MVTNNLRTTLESTKQRASLAESTKLKSTLVTLEEVPGGVPYFFEAGLAADLSTTKKFLPKKRTSGRNFLHTCDVTMQAVNS